MISIRLVLFICLHYVAFTLSNFLSVKDQMYADIRADYPCFLRLNGTHKFGCTSSRFGNVGTLHLITNSSDIDWLLNEGMADPYIVALTPKMFNKEVLERIEWSKNKINGIMLLMNGTNHEVINNDDLLKHGFSPEDTCPNRYTDSSSCPKTPWNPYGSSILLRNWSFPIFIVYDQNTIKEVVDCFEKHNLPLNSQNDHPLCALELKSHMYAAVDSKTCMRRTIMSYQNIRPIKFCDPLGDKNVYWSLKELTPNTSNQSIAIVAARLDATSMFQDLTPGALSTATSIVALMATAKLISEMIPYNISKNYSKNVMFILFNGETYDYIGSSRVEYDMSNEEFPNNEIKLNQDHVGLFIELSQIHYDKEVVIYRPIKYNASENVKNFMNSFQSSLRNDGFIINESKSDSIPPASLHSFLKTNPQFPGVVLTGFDKQFKNKFYHSVMDDADNIQFDNLKLSQTIASISTSLSNSLYKFITNENYTGLKQANSSYISELLHCYVKSMNCEIFQSLTSPIQLPESPPNYYISVNLITNTITSLTRILLASFGSEKINSVQNEEDCLTYETKQGFTSVWLRGNYNACYSTTSNYTEAVSPAFVIPDYDLSSPRYSTWTESVWHEVQIRMFLKQSPRLQIIIFIIGISIFLFSFIIVRKLFTQSEIYFKDQEVSSVTNF